MNIDILNSIDNFNNEKYSDEISKFKFSIIDKLLTNFEIEKADEKFKDLEDYMLKFKEVEKLKKVSIYYKKMRYSKITEFNVNKICEIMNCDIL